jgi:hypothetical protein
MTTPIDFDDCGDLDLPMQLILRDEDGNDVEVIPINGPDVDFSTGIALLQGYSGFYHTPITQVRKSYAYQPGATLSDYPRVEERILEFRLGTKARNWRGLRVVESLLWRVLNFRHDCILRVYFDTGVDDWREIAIRLERKPKDLMKLAPGRSKAFAWDITALACDPYWYSKELVDEVTFDTGTGSGASRVSNRVLQVPNPADQECWLEYATNELTATSTFTLPDGLAVYPAGHALAGQRITHTIPPMGAGKSFLVETYPLNLTLQPMDESQGVALMKAEDFISPLPPGTNEPVDLPVKLVGGTAATKLAVYAVQKWDRFFGGEV